MSSIDNASMKVKIWMECESFLEELKMGFGKDHVANTSVHVRVELKLTWEK